MRDLAGNIALVTGAGSAIGRALALQLAGSGMRIAVSDIDAARVEATAAAVRETGVAAVAFACDVSDREAVKAMVAGVADRLGLVSLLCANAGVTAFEAFADMADREVDWIHGVDFYGVSHCIRAVLPGMTTSRQGHVVNAASFLSRSAEQVARMALEGILENRAVVVTDHTMRSLFEAHAADILQAFDAASAFAAREQG